MTEAMRIPVPSVDVSAENNLLWDALHRAVTGVMLSGQFILGPQVAAFEREAAQFLGVKHAVGCNSGTDALVLSLRALGIGPGDEVITTPFTFVATAEAIRLAGATPVFVDIDPTTFNLDPERIDSAVSERTRAVLPVHLFGRAADMDAIGAIAARYGLRVVEDAAQAFGARHAGRRLGGIGHAGAFSFYPSKNLSAFGDGGLVATNDDDAADRMRLLRVHGCRVKPHSEVVGYNSRLDELQAAVLRVKLPHVDAWNTARHRAAERYDERLAGIPWLATPAPAADGGHVHHQYTVRIVGEGRKAPDREKVRNALCAAGIGAAVYYPVAIHHLAPYSVPGLSLPHAERACREVLSLPIGPMLTAESIDRVVGVFRSLI